MKPSVPDYILAIKPYVAGKPLEELEREYGIKDAIKLASNENPLGPSPLAVEAIGAAVSKLNRYPDGGGYEMTRCIAEKFNIAPESIVLGNGSDDIIALLACTLLSPGDEVVLPRPSFLFYEISLRSAGAVPVWVPLKSNAIDLAGIQQTITPKTRLVFLNVPFNPTGAIITRTDFDNFLSDIPPQVVVVMDEAYIEFVRDPDCVHSLDYIQSDRFIVGMRTFSKAYGLAGLRVGYGFMAPPLAELLNRVRQPFNVNSLAQVGAMAALKDDEFLQATTRLVHAELDFLYASLKNLGLEYMPSQANFLMINVGRSADDVFEQLLKRGVIVRSMSSYSYPEYIRVNIGLHAENVRFLQALEGVLSED